MTLLATFLCLALTRAEIVERFRAAPIVQVSGMVEVWADCDTAMRREHQLPIAAFVGSVCRELYRVEGKPPVRFELPAIVVHIGDGVDSNLTDVVVRPFRRDDGSAATRLYIPAPGFVDVNRLRNESVKAFYRTHARREITDAEALAQIRKAFPELRIADEYAALEAWLRGDSTDDAKGLGLLRTVIAPGRSFPVDARLFASRLYLYPPEYDLRFLDGSDVLPFRDAVAAARRDPSVRLAALLKMNALAVHGAGHDERLTRACVGATEFLKDLAAGGKTDAELYDRLNRIERLLKEISHEEERADDYRQHD